MLERLAFSKWSPFTYFREPAPITCLGLMGCSGVWGKLQVEILSKINGPAQQAALSWKETRDAVPWISGFPQEERWSAYYTTLSSIGTLRTSGLTLQAAKAAVSNLSAASWVLETPKYMHSKYRGHEPPLPTAHWVGDGRHLSVISNPDKTEGCTLRGISPYHWIPMAQPGPSNVYPTMNK